MKRFLRLLRVIVNFVQRERHDRLYPTCQDIHLDLSEELGMANAYIKDLLEEIADLKGETGKVDV